MKFGQILSNPSLGGKVLLRGGQGGIGDIFEGQTKNIGIAVIAFVTVFLLVLALCWFTCYGDRSEGMVGGVTGDWHGAPPSSDTFGFGLLDKFGQRNQNYGDDPMGRPIHKTVGEMGEAINTAYFRQRQAEEGFDPNAIVAGKEDYADIDPNAVQLAELFADTGDELSPTWGYAPPMIPFAKKEGMANDEPIYDVSGNIYRSDTVLKNPDAWPGGYNDWAVAQAERVLKRAYSEKAMENMADVGPMAAQDSTRKVIPIQTVGRGVFGLEETGDQLEAYRNIKVPRRAKYEHMSNTPDNVQLSTLLGVNNNADSTVKWDNPYNPFPDPTRPIVSNLKPAALKYRSDLAKEEGFGLAGYHKKKGYLGSLGGTVPRGSAYDNLGTDVTNMPYTGDKAEFISLFQNKDLADVIEDKCDQYGRCDISYVGGPKKLGTIIDLVYQLSPSERQELKNLAGKFSRYQLNARDRIAALQQKRKMATTNHNIKYTALDTEELNNLKKFVAENGVEIDKFHELTEKAAVKLSQKRYIIPSHTPSNACKVPPGLRYYGPAGKLQRLTKFVPSNSCQYQDLKNLEGAAAYTNLTNADAVKISDSVASVTKKQ